MTALFIITLVLLVLSLVWNLIQWWTIRELVRIVKAERRKALLTNVAALVAVLAPLVVQYFTNSEEK